MAQLELGLDTFGDVTRGADGLPVPFPQVIRNVIAEGVLADHVGVDFIGLGEHHRSDFAVSAPETALAAIAGQTGRIRLGSAVTVLSSDDPIRVFQRFATLDAASNGRAEKLDLFSHLLEEQPVTWSGSIRPPLSEQQVYPTTEGGHLKTWIGVGGSPESVVRAARYRMPLMLAIIGGAPERFAPYADLFHRALDQLDVPQLPIGVHSPGYVADTDEQAREELWPDYKVMRDRIGASRGWPPMARAEFDQEVEHGSLYVGSPETVARKIAKTAGALGIDRFDLKYSAGPLPHEKLMHGIELYGTKVIPMVRDLLA